MPAAQYYGPLERGQTRQQLGARYRQANAAYRMARAAHAYAARHNVYNRVYQGLKSWARSSAAERGSTFRTAGGRKVSMDKWGTPMMRNTVKPLRKKFPSNNRRVRFVGRGKKRKAIVKIPRVLSTHPHTVRQTVYFAKNSLEASTKSISSLQPFELYPSLTQQFLTGLVFDLTKTWWGTTTIDGTNKARIGNQVVPLDYSDMYLTGANNDLNIQKRCTMLTLNNLPEQPNGLIPNNHFVTGFNIQLDIQTLVPGSQQVCIQVVRRSSRTDPVSNGVITPADFQEMVNDIKVVDKDKFETVYQKVLHLPGLTPGQPVKHYRIKKYIKCMLKRNTLRRTTSISAFPNSVGGQIKPHYEFSSGGEMYNQCFIIVKAKRYNDTANVVSQKTGTGVTPGTSNYPKVWDEMTPAKCALTGATVSQTISFNGHTEPQMDTTSDAGIYKGACIKMRGTVSSYFRVREILNQDVDNTADVQVSEDWPDENLEPIHLIDEYESEPDDHVHEVDHTDGTTSTTGPPQAPP